MNMNRQAEGQDRPSSEQERHSAAQGSPSPEPERQATGQAGPEAPSHYRFAIGQDSHRFARRAKDGFESMSPWDSAQSVRKAERANLASRTLMLGGVALLDEVPLEGNSDADVILHALTNAVSGISGQNILGLVADRLCQEQGITDSRVYLQAALNTLGERRLVHVSISVEACRPRLAAYIPRIRASVAELLGLPVDSVGLTATSGEGLTEVGRGDGIAVVCAVTAYGP